MQIIFSTITSSLKYYVKCIFPLWPHCYNNKNWIGVFLAISSFSALQCNLFTLGAFKMLVQPSFGRRPPSFTNTLSLSSITFQIQSPLQIFYFSSFANNLFHYIRKNTTTIHFSVCFLSIDKTDLLPNCFHFFLSS